MAQIRVMQVVEVLSTEGVGTHRDPFRTVTEYFTMEGERLARVVPEAKPSVRIEDVAEGEG